MYQWSNVKYSFMYREFLETPAGFSLEIYIDALLYEASYINEELDLEKLEMLRAKYSRLRREALEAIMDVVACK
jgi:hypothetical protein